MRETGESRIYAAVRPTLKHRIEKLLEKEQINPAEAGRRGGVGRTLIYDILKEKTKNLRGDTANKLAAALDCDVAYLTGEQPEPRKHSESLEKALTTGVVSAPVVGDIAAGVWHESNPFTVFDPDSRPDNEETPLVPYVPDPKFSGLKQFAVRVKGPSVNKVIPDGYYAICVPYWEARTAIQDGDLVVVERTRAGLHEGTIKKVARVRGGYELRPDSDDPRHRDPIVLAADLEHDKNDPDVRVEIVGLVIGKYSPL